jgi:hypothetical protein
MGGEVQATILSSESEVGKHIEDYQTKYPFAGYGTRIKMITQDKGKIKVLVTRNKTSD